MAFSFKKATFLDIGFIYIRLKLVNLFLITILFTQKEGGGMKRKYENNKEKTKRKRKRRINREEKVGGRCGWREEER